MQIADLKAQAERSNADSGSAWEELRITRKRCDEIASELAKLKAEVSFLTSACHFGVIVDSFCCDILHDC